MRHLVRFAGIPSVTFGPGSMAVAHGANEYIDLDEYVLGIRALARLIVAWCGPPKPNGGPAHI